MQSASALTVYDPANYSQNIITSAKMVRQEINQLKQLANEAKNIASGKFLGDFSDVKEIVKTINEVKSSAEQVQSAIGSAQTVSNQMRAMYGAGNYKSPQQFLDVLSARTKAGEAVATELMRSADAATKTLIRTGEVHQKIVDKASSIQGITEATQMTTAAIASVIEQNQAMLGMMAASSRSESVKVAKETAQRDNEVAIRAKRVADSEAALAAYKASIENFGK